MRYLLLMVGLFALSCTEVSEAKVIKGKVIKIADGDTFTLLTSDTQKYKIRLLDIDCPEKGQPHGKGAKQMLASFIFGKEVWVEYKKKDRYGRILGHVYIQDVFVNMVLVDSGYAWHFKKYSKNEQFAIAEARARENRLGLWQDKYPIAPWDWRKGKREK